MFWFRTPHPLTGEPLEVEAVYVRPRRGRRDEFGLPLEPDEPEAIILAEIRDRDGQIIDSEIIEEKVEVAAWRYLERET
jgi:hypothetical protein